MMTIGNLLTCCREICNSFSTHRDTEEIMSEAVQILSYLLDKSIPYIKLHPESEVSEVVSNKLVDNMQRLISGEPVAYIIGKAFFYNEEYEVGPGVLIPRPDTEILVESTIECIKNSNISEPIIIWDLCTGTGCVGISVANALDDLGIEYRMYLVDYSDEALIYTKRNLSKYSNPNIEIVRLDVLKDLSSMPSSTPNYIISNPPYITEEDMKTLDSSVNDYEPHVALYGNSSDGLDFYRSILQYVKGICQNDINVILEHGYNQEQELALLLEHNEIENIRCIYDYGGNPRVTMGVRRSDG